MDSTNAIATTGSSGLVGRMQTTLSRLGGAAAEPGLRRAAPAILVTLAAALGLLIWLLLAPESRSDLASGLTDTERAAALDTLNAAGFAAALDPSTGTITVPKADYQRARLALAAEGLPSGTPDGLSMLSDMPMGTSRSVEGARLRRMLELDLSSSIAALEQVDSARVHLALPERSAFVRDVEPARAAVVLNLRRGTNLGESQVNAIVNMVSGAVPNMQRDAVSVVDQYGRLLSTDASDPIAMAGDRQLRLKTEREQLLRKRVESLLTPILGMGNVAVEVTLDMEFTESEITREDYAPDGIAIRSEQENVTETVSSKVGGVPGAVTNTPPPDPTLQPQQQAQAPQPAEAPTNRSTATTRNYEVSRRIETTRPQTAVVTRMNAAILVSSNTGSDAEAGTLPELATVEALAKSALGFDAARGDVVTVSQGAFVQAEVLAAPAWYEAAWLPDLGRVLLQLGVLAIVAHAVIRPLLSQLLNQTTGGQAAVFADDTIEVGPGETLGALRARLDRLPGSASDYDGGLAYSEKVDLLRQLADEETGRVASVIEGLVKTGEEART